MNFNDSNDSIRIIIIIVIIVFLKFLSSSTPRFQSLVLQVHLYKTRSFQCGKQGGTSVTYQSLLRLHALTAIMYWLMLLKQHTVDPMICWIFVEKLLEDSISTRHESDTVVRSA